MQKSIVSPVNLPGAFTYDPNNPTYFTEWLSYVLLQNLQALDGEGFQWQGSGVIPTNLWSLQDDLITKQNAYIDDVKSYFNAKHSELPSQENIWDLLTGEFGQWLAGVAGNHFWGPVGQQVATLAVKFLGYAIDVLRKMYTAGGALLDALKAENTEILSLPQSIAYYRMRNAIIQAHDRTIHNLIVHVQEAEQKVMEQVNRQGVNMEEDSGSVISELQQITQKLEDLKYNEEILEIPATPQPLRVHLQSKLFEI